MNSTIEMTPPVLLALPSGDVSPRRLVPVSRLSRPVPWQTTRSDLFGINGRRSALEAAYPELRAVCTTLGFGYKFTLNEWSLSPGWAVLTLARAARPPPSAPILDWGMATIPELVTDIVRTHHVPLRHELERLGVIIDHLAIAHPCTALSTLHKAYHAFKDALSLHLDQEECDLFPLCIELEEALSDRRTWAGQDVTSIIRLTSHGHEECENALHRIIDLLHAAAASDSDRDIAVVSEGMHALDRDFDMHTAKERELLIPAAIFSEEHIRAGRSAGRIIGAHNK